MTHTNKQTKNKSFIRYSKDNIWSSWYDLDSLLENIPLNSTEVDMVEISETLTLSQLKRFYSELLSQTKGGGR